MARKAKETTATKTTPKKESKAIVKKQTAAMAKAGLDFEAQAGGGFEEGDSDSYAIPFLVLLQKNSPQVDDDSPSKVEGAKAGHFFNTVTGEVFDEVDFIPCHYSRSFINWRSREEGGGFLGQYAPDDPIVATGERGKSGRLELEDGTHLADTRHHFGIVVKPDGSGEPVLIGLASTQIKKSRAFMSLMRGIKIKRGDGSTFTPPMFSHLYKLTSVGEAKDQYTWKGIKVELVRTLGEADLDLYQAAKEFKTQIAEGAAKVGAPPENVPASTDDDFPEDF